MQHRQNYHLRFSSLGLMWALLGLSGCSGEGNDEPYDSSDGEGASELGDRDVDGDGDGATGDGDSPVNNGNGAVDEGNSDGALAGPRAKIPGANESWLFIGQDLVSIANYADEVAEPKGIVGYTSLYNLEGLDSSADNGGGPNHMHNLAARYPNARIAIGLYLVDYLDAINAGEADDKIAQLAELLKVYDRTVLLRIGYEFDAGWTRQEPEAYKAAYHRIAEGIRDAGADNVAFVWQSAALCDGRFMGLPLASWWPGDEYVDWIGLSYFTQVACGYAPVQEVVDYARRQEKPVFIAEATPQWYDLEELTFSANGINYTPQSESDVWDNWFTPFFQFISDNNDVIRGVTYINADWDTQGQWDSPYENGYWGDSRVQANSTILSNWESVVTDQGWD